MEQKQTKFKVQFYHGIFVVAAILVIFSCIAAYSLSATFWKNLGVGALGLLLMFITSKISYTKLTKSYKLWYILSGFLLLITLLCGVGGGGRSLHLGSVQLQTFPIITALFTFAMSISLAKKLTNNRDDKQIRKNDAIKLLVVLILFVACIALRNVSTAILLFIVGVSMLLVANVKIKYLLVSFFFLGFAAVLYMGISDLRSNSSTQAQTAEIVDDMPTHRGGTMKARLKYYFTGESDVQGYGFQMTMSKAAVARSAHATGPGKGILKDRMPERENDFIYAMICEEFSLVAGIFIALLYFVIFHISILIARKAAPRCNFIRIFSVGIGVMIIAQAYIHITVNEGLIPATGQTLPFLSRGMVNVIVTSILLGMLMNMGKKVLSESKDDEDLLMDEDEF